MAREEGMKVSEKPFYNNVELYDGTITADTTTVSIDVALCRECHVLLDVTAVSGTDPTLVPKVETSYDGTTWFTRGVIIDHKTQGDLTRLTAPTDEAKIKEAGKYSAILLGGLGRYLRVNFIVGGTTPSFTVTCWGVFR